MTNEYLLAANRLRNEIAMLSMRIASTESADCSTVEVFKDETYFEDIKREVLTRYHERLSELQTQFDKL